MTCCVYCVNIVKIKKAARMLRKAVPPMALLPPFPVKKVMKNLKIGYKGKWYQLDLIETDLLPIQAEALSFLDGGVIKVVMVKNYDKYYSNGRRNWTLAHELSHICLGHVFIPGNRLTDRLRWYLDKEANKLAREILLWDRLMKGWLFEGENLTPLKKNYMAVAFGVSIEALENAIDEYDTESNPTNNYRCLYYPKLLECVSKSARKRCISKKQAHRQCSDKLSESAYYIDLAFRPISSFNSS